MRVKIVHIDLQQPIRDLYLDWAYRKVFVFAFWGYKPLGLMQMDCPRDARLIQSRELRMRLQERFAWEYWQEHAATALTDLKTAAEWTLPPISVVVCTRDRPQSLDRCLTALCQVDYPDFEIVVVDNCSSDPAVKDVIRKHGARYVREDTPGLDWARNRGIEESRHDIIAYIDDDAYAGRGWLRGVASGFEDDSIMAVTGLVLPAELETPAQLEFEEYGGMNKGFRPFSVHVNSLARNELFWASKWGIGANMAYRRRLFDYIGNFTVSLDVGTPTNGGGDLEFFHRLIAKGYVLRYEPAAVINHVHRRDRESLHRQIYNNGRSFAAYLMTVARKSPEKRLPAFKFAMRWWLWEWLLKRLFKSLRHRDGLTARFAVAELRGLMSAYPNYKRARKLAQKLKFEKRKKIIAARLAA